MQKLLLFNSKSYEYILLDGNSTSEIAGRSANAWPLFQLLDTTARTLIDTEMKGAWAGDPIFLVNSETRLDIETPPSWVPIENESWYDFICKFGKNITHKVTF